MPGRIRDEDVALVRERSGIGDIAGEHLTLRGAGGGSLKGLCPFHDEKTPSFHVTPSRGFYHCFGCGEGGDVIDFVMKVDHLTFAEAVEHLAARAGVQLRYEESGATNRPQGQRTRLVESHRDAAQFYAEQLAGPDAVVARQFLSERGFDRGAAEAYGVGYAPRGWDDLVRHLRGRGYSDRELLVGGLAREGRRGPVDRFVGRLLWPIRDITGDVVGFGARRLHDDDRIEAKYLNTAETPLYKKSQLLYGIDMAKREIAKRQQAVVVEGYTDVMACHLAGVPTAVATCGTAFGSEHIKVLRRLLMDQSEFHGEVIFTFDGDEAGQKAALRAFEDDQKFVAQTFVAVDSEGLDPCDVRQRRGDEAVRDLVARRIPLFEFAIRSALARHDLTHPEGRSAAASAGLATIRGIRDVSLRIDYARQLAGWVGWPDPNELVAQARGDVGQVARVTQRPDPRDAGLTVERESLKFALQQPVLAGPAFDALDAEAFTGPAYARVHAAVRAAGGTSSAAGGEAWVTAVREQAADDVVRSLVAELAVEPLHVDGEAEPRHADELMARLQEGVVARRVAELRSRVQRMNPEVDVEAYNKLFGELIALEQYRIGLRQRALRGI